MNFPRSEFSWWQYCIKTRQINFYKTAIIEARPRRGGMFTLKIIIKISQHSRPVRRRLIGLPTEESVSENLQIKWTTLSNASSQPKIHLVTIVWSVENYRDAGCWITKVDRRPPERYRDPRPRHDDWLRSAMRRWKRNCGGWLIAEKVFSFDDGNEGNNCGVSYWRFGPDFCADALNEKKILLCPSMDIYWWKARRTLKSIHELLFSSVPFHCRSFYGRIFRRTTAMRRHRSTNVLTKAPAQ